MRTAWLALALVVMITLTTVAGREGAGRGLQQVALPSLFPGADSGSSAAAPDAAASPTPAAASPSPSSSSPSPSPSASPSPAAAPVKAPTPSASATAPTMAAPMMAPGSAPAMAPMAGAGAPAPMAAIATGAGDMASGAAPAQGPGALGAGMADIIYMQQSGNVQMMSAPGNPNAGSLSMNNALDTTLYDQSAPVRKIGKTSTNDFLNAAANGTNWFTPPPLAVLLGFNTSKNGYLLLSLSTPSYNYTTNTVGFNYTVANATDLPANGASNGFVVNYYINYDSDSGMIPLELSGNSTTLFTPTLFYTIPCALAGPVPNNTCMLAGKGACAGADHGSWRNSVFCA